MNYKLVKFKKEHLEVMDLRPHEETLLKQTDYAQYLEQSVAVTGIVDGRIVCCGGLNIMPGGNADIWLIPSIHVKRHAKLFVKVLRDWLAEKREDFQLSRMQTICLNDELHNRWMKFLGFEKEGVLKKFCNDTDYVIYGRTEWA